MLWRAHDLVSLTNDVFGKGPESRERSATENAEAKGRAVGSGRTGRWRGHTEIRVHGGQSAIRELAQGIRAGGGAGRWDPQRRSRCLCGSALREGSGRVEQDVPAPSAPRVAPKAVPGYS